MLHPPEKPEEINKTAKNDPTMAPLAGSRFLVAEDNESNQFLMQRLIKLSGGQVEIVSDGQQAVETALKQSFDLVLMDVQMPVLDGYQATMQLRAAGCKTPIITLTGHTHPDERLKSFNAGCDDYLVKPITRQSLLNAIDRTLRRRHLEI